MRLAIAGTPGTGKTTLAALVAEELGVPCYDSLDVARRCQAVTGRDEDRDGAWEVDEQVLWERSALAMHLDCVVEGVLAPWCRPHLTLVLRTAPDVLRERLGERDWSDAKVEENVEAELVDTVLLEASGANGVLVLEADTTSTPAEDIAAALVELVRTGLDDVERPLEGVVREPGSTNWLEEAA